MWCCYPIANISCDSFVKEQGSSLSPFHPMNTSKLLPWQVVTPPFTLFPCIFKDMIQCLYLAIVHICTLLHSHLSSMTCGEGCWILQLLTRVVTIQNAIYGRQIISLQSRL